VPAASGDLYYGVEYDGFAYVAGTPAPTTYSIPDLGFVQPQMFAFEDANGDGVFGPTDPGVLFYENPATLWDGGAVGPLLGISDAGVLCSVTSAVQPGGQTQLNFVVQSNLDFPYAAHLLDAGEVPAFDLGPNPNLPFFNGSPGGRATHTFGFVGPINLSSAPPNGQSFPIVVSRLSQGPNASQFGNPDGTELCTPVSTILPQPTNLAAVSAGSDVTLSWTLPGLPIKNCQISLALADGGSQIAYWNPIACPNPVDYASNFGSASGSPPALVSGTEYQWTLTIYDDLGNNTGVEASFTQN
jgi:hypothetical protein